MATCLYHIASNADWQAAQSAGYYAPPSLAEAGFIHCAWREQIIPVAETFYSARRDVWLLVIDTGRLSASWREEAPAGAPPRGVDAEARFPHIYGALNLDAVVQALPFLPSAEGRFSLPEMLIC